MSGAAIPTLSERALNRATLARQGLLERSALDASSMIEHLVGLQAQNPLDPFLALWSRLAPFDPRAVNDALMGRRLVRIVVMRGTIHLVSAADAHGLRPHMQPVLTDELRRHREFAPQLVGVDVTPVLQFAEAELAATPMAGNALRARLAERFPRLHAAALAYACRCLLPLVQIPPRGMWGHTLQVTLAPLGAWTDPPTAPPPTLEDVLVRYLAAFGPATVADAAAWSRLAGLGAAFASLEPRLVAFRDERGRRLFDVPDAPRPDEHVPAPVRFLPEYDNVLLSHADRRRFLTAADRQRFSASGVAVKGTALIDGTVQAVWHTERDRRAGRAVLVVHHVPLPAATRAELQAEAERTAAFWLADAEQHDVRVLPLP